jgi:hypothetical protein
MKGKLQFQDHIYLKSVVPRKMAALALLQHFEFLKFECYVNVVLDSCPVQERERVTMQRSYSVPG